MNPDGFGRRQDFQGGTIYWKANEAYFVGGAIRTKWNQLGPQPAERSFLGYPLSDEIKLPDGAGRMNRFEFGVIYWYPDYGAHPVSGGILNTWQASGYETGSYGYPIADQTSGVGTQVNQQFEFATIGWPTNPAAAIVDDGDINPTVQAGGPTTVAEFFADSREGIGPGGIQVVANWNTHRDPCITESSCVEPRDEEDPILSGQDPTELIPSNCITAPKDNTLRGDRKYACGGSKFVLLVFKFENGGIAYKGALPFDVLTGVITSQRNGKFMQSYRFNFGTALGDIGTPTLSYTPNYQGQTTPTNYSVTGFQSGGTITAGSSKEITLTYNELPMGDNQQQMRSTALAYSFGNADPYIPSPTYNLQLESKIRCDKTIRNSTGALVQGCVFPDVRPILDYRQSNGGSGFPQLIGHISAAAGTGLPGTSYQRPLHREADTQKRNANRNKACPKRGSVNTGRRVTGRDCDEYPFASTKEGADSGGPGRTFQPNCHVPDLTTINSNTGYSVCMIDSGQNRSGGSALGQLYGSSRIIDNDAFYVAVQGGALPPAP